MLGDLKKVQDNLYSDESIQAFLKVRSVQDAIRLLNKASKQQTRNRITKFFSKLNDSLYYKQLLYAGLNDDAEKKDQFQKYIFSEYCQEYYQLLLKKTQQVLSVVEHTHKLMPVLFSLVYSPQGIKMIKFFNQLYSKYSDHQFLYTEEVQGQLNLGISAQDSIVQMRFVQIITNIAIQGGKPYKFVQKSLDSSLNIYETQDILLKLNIVQIVSLMGQGYQTSQLLRGHRIWSKVQKDAMNPDQQFYVRKSLLMLLVEMAAHQQYQMNPKFVKHLIQFLKYCLQNKGQYLEGGLDIIGRLCISAQGSKILVQNNQVFNRFLIVSRTNVDQIRTQFFDVLMMLTDKTNGKKSKPIIINILSCIGNPNLSGELSHNIHSNNFIAAGVQPFCHWYSQFLILPFQDLEMKLIGLFLNLIEYIEICQTLFQQQNVTKFLLRPISVTNSNKVLRMQKGKLIHTIIQKGQKQWKGTKLEHYSAMLQKQLSKQKTQVAYALDVE